MRLTRTAIAVPAAPALHGLTIAVISDLHGGAPFIDTAKIDAVTAMANAARPDLILLTGDFVTHVLGGRPMTTATIAAHLKALSAPLGVYAVIGNHDRWDGADSIAAALTGAGITVLENASTAIATPRGTLYLAGIGDDYSQAADPAKALADLPAGAAALCFTHSPDVFPDLPETCALTIAGHTHGGQVNLPFVGRMIVPSRYGQRYAAGTVVEGGKTLFVSTGIGTSVLPIRFGVPPEVALLTLQ